MPLLVWTYPASSIGIIPLMSDGLESEDESQNMVCDVTLYGLVTAVRFRKCSVKSLSCRVGMLFKKSAIICLQFYL